MRDAVVVVSRVARLLLRGGWIQGKGQVIQGAVVVVVAVD